MVFFLLEVKTTEEVVIPLDGAANRDSAAGRRSVAAFGSLRSILTALAAQARLRRGRRLDRRV
jgi:hypothetical protein